MVSKQILAINSVFNPESLQHFDLHCPDCDYELFFLNSLSELFIPKKQTQFPFNRLMFGAMLKMFAWSKQKYQHVGKE